MKTRSRNGIIRKRILKILEKPTSVSELKSQLTEISSFGTIAYHLKELEKEDLIIKEKEKKQRGQPTKYFLKSQKKDFSEMSMKQIKEFMRTEKDKDRIKILKMLKEKPRHPDELYEKFGDNGNDIIWEDKNFIDVKVFIKPEGEKLLKENS